MDFLRSHDKTWQHWTSLATVEKFVKMFSPNLYYISYRVTYAGFRSDWVMCNSVQNHPENAGQD